MVQGDLYDIEGRLREYDPDLSLTYDGNGRWTVHHRGAQGRPYPVLTVGAGCGNRWPKDDPHAPEITCLDMRVLYLIQEADLHAHGGADAVVNGMDHREWVEREARKAKFASKAEDAAREMYPFAKRELQGMPDLRVYNPVVKPQEVAV